MAKPEPQPGLIIRYDYLWRAEYEAGRREGTKYRPCAIIVAIKSAVTHEDMLLVCPVTHTPPTRESDGVKIPVKLARFIGLDSENSWVKTNEMNRVFWSDPGIIPIHAGQWIFGNTPDALFYAIKDSILAHQRNQTLTIINRTDTPPPSGKR